MRCERGWHLLRAVDPDLFHGHLGDVGCGPTRAAESASVDALTRPKSRLQGKVVHSGGDTELHHHKKLVRAQAARVWRR